MSSQFKPPAPEEPPFDEETLKDIRRNLSMLSAPSVRNEYRRLHKQCDGWRQAAVAQDRSRVRTGLPAAMEVAGNALASVSFGIGPCFWKGFAG